MTLVGRGLGRVPGGLGTGAPSSLLGALDVSVEGIELSVERTDAVAVEMPVAALSAPLTGATFTASIGQELNVQVEDTLQVRLEN